MNPKRWRDWCMSEDEKKEIDRIFPDKVRKRLRLVEYF